MRVLEKRTTNESGLGFAPMPSMSIDQPEPNAVTMNLFRSLFTLPPPHQRKELIVPMRHVHKLLRRENDAEYLCYVLVNVASVVSTLLMIVLLLDYILASDLVLDAADIERNPWKLAYGHSRYVSWIMLLLAALFYARIRSSLNIRLDDIPVLIHPALYLGASRRRWILRSSLVVVGFLGVMFISHIVTVRLATHFELQNSIAWIAVIQAFFGLGLSMGGAAIVAYSLVLEKAVRFFPEFSAELERKAKTTPIARKD